MYILNLDNVVCHIYSIKRKLFKNCLRKECWAVCCASSEGLCFQMLAVWVVEALGRVLCACVRVNPHCWEQSCTPEKWLFHRMPFFWWFPLFGWDWKVYKVLLTDCICIWQLTTIIWHSYSQWPYSSFCVCSNCT